MVYINKGTYYSDTLSHTYVHASVVPEEVENVRSAAKNIFTNLLAISILGD